MKTRSAFFEKMLMAKKMKHRKMRKMDQCSCKK